MKVQILAIFLAFSLSVPAAVITHGSSGGVFTYNSGASTASSTDFDWAVFNFAPEFVDTIELSNFGSGFAHDHNTGARSQFDVFNGTSWINVFDAALPPLNGRIPLSSLYSAPITFSGTTISAIRLGGDKPVAFVYHGVSPNLTYTLSGAAFLPEPSAVFCAMLAASVAFIGLRRRFSSDRRLRPISR